MVFFDPTITVRVNGVVWAVDPTVSWSPGGLVWKVRLTVWGSSRTVSVSLSPPGSVAVRVSSRYDGYSWSDAVKLPEAGRVPLWASLAPPEKLIRSPTFQCRLEPGWRWWPSAGCCRR
jgi:hypothetical protein